MSIAEPHATLYSAEGFRLSHQISIHRLVGDQIEQLLILFRSFCRDRRPRSGPQAVKSFLLPPLPSAELHPDQFPCIPEGW